MHDSNDITNPITTNTSPTSNTNDLNNLPSAELISRITALEEQLKKTTAQLTALTTTSTTTVIPAEQPKVKVKKQARPFDISAYATRHIALKFSYIGTGYNGFEHTNNISSAPAKPTIEEVLWKALRKARLICPAIPEGADTSYDVVWDERTRAARYGVGVDGIGRGRKGKERLELVWDGLSYSKCGRTDKGVSAFGQVVGITVRSSKPVKRRKSATMVESGDDDEAASAGHTDEDHDDLAADWDSIRDELPYVSILNAVLPPTIRILAWCPDPTSTFDARFSCKERRYKYFFTNPAMCPTPGKIGIMKPDGTQVKFRDGWLDIEAMKVAAKKLEGLHDYRNLCKIDASKQMPSCERRITFADIEEFNGSMDAFMRDPRLNQDGSTINGIANGLANTVLSHTDGPKVYAFAVHGTAFLWHQVRCMVAVLFLVGQGLEQPEIVDKLLDIDQTPGKPQYEMADDAPLVLWDCVFPGDEPGEDGGMKWIYAGDEATSAANIPKSASKFGGGGLVDQLWVQWRNAKMQETLTAGLLALALRQGDDSKLQLGDQHHASKASNRSQKVFDGSDTPRYVGEYIPVMEKARMEPLEVQNAKYAAGKQTRRDLKRLQDESNTVG